MISMSCSCGGDFWIRDRLAGKTTACPACRRLLDVPPMSSVAATMAPVTCSCGEIYWAATWRPGRRSRCPLCGGGLVSPDETQTLLETPAAPGGGTGPKLPGARPRANRPVPPRPIADAATARPAAPAPTGTNARRPGVLLAGGGAAALLLILAAVWLTRPGQSPPNPESTAPAPAVVEAGSQPALPAPAAGTPGPVPAAPEVQTPETRSLASATPSGTPGSETRLRLIVPAYFYPAGRGLEDWERLLKAAGRVPVIAIVNPASGPGTEANPDYAQIVRRAAERGLVTIGYVSTNYAKRPRAEIEAEIDRWVRFYPEIRGIFLDAQASGAEQVPFYQSLGQYVRNRIDRAVLVTNPGTLCAEGYFAEVPLDSAVVFENAQGFPDFHLPPWAGKYAAPEFSVVPYHVDTPEQMKAILQAAVLKGIGGIYVTDAMLPNPWDRLPAYFEDEVEAVRRLNLRMAP